MEWSQGFVPDLLLVNHLRVGTMFYSVFLASNPVPGTLLLFHCLLSEKAGLSGLFLSEKIWKEKEKTESENPFCLGWGESFLVGLSEWKENKERLEAGQHPISPSNNHGVLGKLLNLVPISSSLK